MGLRLYNTMGRRIQEFEPITPGFVGFYGCGPTVYNYAHIGNLRAYVFLDTLDRTLTFLGYDKKHVMNITDIGHLTGDSDDGEDKMLKTATARHQSVLEVAQFYTDAFFKDLDALNIIRPDVVCKATEHVQEMIELIKRIEANGHTYMAGGNLYYDVSTYSHYGDLACLNLDELKTGAGKRDVVVVDENKRNPYDFVLWFTKSKFENQALTWDSPWGRGYPGWHIECSAMSMKYLGEHFDIHTGGIDHIPIHHTNEIAQSEGATGKKWVNYWLHNEFLVLAKDKQEAQDGGEKMSKSSGNFLTLSSLLERGYDALDYRFFLLGGHYRKQIYFSWEALDGARNSRLALVQRIARLAAQGKISLEHIKTAYKKGEALSTGGFSQKACTYIEQFKDALESDLATPKALSVMQKVVKDSTLAAKEALELVSRMDSVLGLNVVHGAAAILEEESAKMHKAQDHSDDPEAEEINALVLERTAAKQAKDFARADSIRAELSKRGIIVTDTAQGVTWARK